MFTKGLLRPTTVVEPLVKMDALSEAENIVADYRHPSLTMAGIHSPFSGIG